VSAGQAPFLVVATPKIPEFPSAQIGSWETDRTGTITIAGRLR